MQWKAILFGAHWLKLPLPLLFICYLPCVEKTHCRAEIKSRMGICLSIPFLPPQPLWHRRLLFYLGKQGKIGGTNSLWSKLGSKSCSQGHGCQFSHCGLALHFLPFQMEETVVPEFYQAGRSLKEKGWV